MDLPSLDTQAPATHDPVSDSAEHIVCMLAEGSYFHGAASLCNSLSRQGFSGLVVLGYRGVVPPWAALLPANRDGSRQFTPQIRLQLIEIAAGWHLTNLKARVMQRAVRENPGFQTLYYLDVDIVMTCAWENFARWVRHGVVLCLDMSDTYMPESHVYRREWQALAERAGYRVRPLSGYFNAGCIGFGPAHIGLLDVWARLIDAFAADGADMTRIVATNGRPEFAKMDQDLLNAALMASDVPIASLGKEAMGSFPYSSILSHAMVFGKPWMRNYVLDALKGFPPDPTDFAFWDHAQHPVASFPPAVLRWKRLQLRLARWLGLIRRRSIHPW